MAVTKAIDFGALVGAQLTALIEAEAEAAEKTAEFIEQVGFERTRGGGLALRMVAFTMQRRDVDGTVRVHTIRVPVLTLVPIPLLSISEANLEFELQIEDVLEVKTGDEESRERNSARGAVRGALRGKKKSRLAARLARTTRRETTTSSDLKMTVKIAQSDFPIGIERLIETADLSVEDETHE